MIRMLPHITSLIFNTPLLIAPARAEALVAGLWAVMRARGPAEVTTEAVTSLPAEETQPQRPRGYRIEKGVGIVPIRGVLVRRAGQVDSQSTPLQSYETTARSLRAARSDPRVKGILLDIDSPGGEAGGLFEMSREIRAAANHKPTWAIANDDALSAAYALGAAASKLWITETGSAGSIGAVALHLDQSDFDADEGLKFTYIYRGAHKVDGHPHGPLTNVALGAIQGEVDRLYGMLVDDIAANRGLDAEALRRTEAAIYYGANVLPEGLADQVGTLDQAHGELAAQVASQGVARSVQQTIQTIGRTHMDDEPREPQDGANNVVPLERVVDERVEARVAEHIAYTAEVARLCSKFGYSDMIDAAVKARTSIGDLGLQILERKAAEDARHQIEAVDPTQVRQTRNADLREAAEARFKAQGQHP